MVGELFLLIDFALAHPHALSNTTQQTTQQVSEFFPFTTRLARQHTAHPIQRTIHQYLLTPRTVTVRAHSIKGKTLRLPLHLTNPITHCNKGTAPSCSLV
jgi:hypothetical protein